MRARRACLQVRHDQIWLVRRRQGGDGADAPSEGWVDRRQLVGRGRRPEQLAARVGRTVGGGDDETDRMWRQLIAVACTCGEAHLWGWGDGAQGRVWGWQARRREAGERIA
eukprot:5443553-Prymnesium_polylepis.1